MQGAYRIRADVRRPAKGGIDVYVDPESIVSAQALGATILLTRVNIHREGSANLSLARKFRVRIVLRRSVLT